MENQPDEINDDPAFTDKEQEDIVASLTSDDIQQRSQALSDAQETYEELAYLANPKMPCPECTGAGNVSGGSLGDICVRCMGTRVIEQPGCQPMPMPDFAGMRRAIGAYGDALADRALPPGPDGKPHRGKRYLALPPPSSVPTLESIQDLHKQGIDRARNILAAGGAPGLVEDRLLKDPKKPSEDGDLGEVDDAELDGIEGGEA